MQKYPVIFNGVPIPSWVRVTGRNISALPSLSPQYRAVPNVAGGQYLRTDLQSRQYSIDIVIEPSQHYNLDQQVELLSDWIRGNNFKPSPLTFIEQTDRYVLAVVSGDVNISDLFVAGTGSINWIAINPVKYLYEETIETVSTENAIKYWGKVEQPFVAEFTLPVDCKTIEFSRKGSKNTVTLEADFKKGQQLIIDSRKKLIKLNNQVNMSLLTFDSQWLFLEYGDNQLELLLDGKKVVAEIAVNYKTGTY